MMQADHHTRFDTGDGGDGRGGGSALRMLTNVLAVVVSLGLLAGFVGWGWTLAVRDVSGVPVVRALEGPMRVAPDDPGGLRAAHQGLSVNAIAAGAEIAPPERVLLAPAPPVLEADAAPPPSPPRDESGAVIASTPGLTRSPVPPPRPSYDLVAETAARAVLQSLAPGATVEIDPDSLAPGTRLVQLGALDDGAAARSEWERLADSFPALFEDKGRVIQAAEAGGRTFYRLRAHGFGTEAEARRFCAVLIAEDVTCIPVLIR
ncbi:SPOR domain-containing protein [Rhodobaculum claviforme]|nr:SPOR domain-containing protein [Rhodobaculum claviforme]